MIRCVHCGTSLREGPDITPAVPSAIGSPADALDGARAVDARPAPVPPPADPWAIPAFQGSRRPATEHTRAKRAVRHLDLALSVAGIAAVGAAIVAYSSLSMPWVDGQIVTMGDRGARVVADLVFQGSDVMRGRVVLGVAAVLLVLGALWFWYSLDLGATLPAFAHPLIALLAAATAGAVLGFSRLGSLFWGDAFVARAREAGLSKDAMRELLDARPAPLVEVEQLGGSYRFGVAAALALAAAGLAWWSQRRRD